VADGCSELSVLRAYQQLIQVISFYQHEVAVISDMLDEYAAYLFAGNFLFAVLGETRSISDMKDFREY
jgi:hypothetical protein